jgi:hypothetical protein
MVSFKTKNSNLGTFWRALDGKVDIVQNVLQIHIWDILWPFGTFCVHLVHFIRFLYHVTRKIWQPCVTPFSWRDFFLHHFSPKKCWKVIFPSLAQLVRLAEQLHLRRSWWLLTIIFAIATKALLILLILEKNHFTKIFSFMGRYVHARVIHSLDT